MPARALTYAVITPARDEEEMLPGLAASLRAQSIVPLQWIIVENGSTDDTARVARELANDLEWVRVVEIPGSASPERGAPIVRALTTALEDIDSAIDYVVSVDADVTFGSDYFARLLGEFAADPTLGIASGRAREQSTDGEWRPIDVTGGSVWGATRAYRRECLDDILPLESRHGWDGMDQLTARSKGWTTRTILDLPFYHHRPEGGRESSTWAHWRQVGETCHYMGYRPWYAALRSLHNLRRSPAASAVFFGYATAAVRRSPQWRDLDARAVLRHDQHPLMLVRRAREARGQVSPGGSAAPHPRRAT
jgi:glycosyltransferase involved in cell wall biosynthesis